MATSQVVKKVPKQPYVEFVMPTKEYEQWADRMRQSVLRAIKVASVVPQKAAEE